ncbi:calcium-transporting ATPase 1, endoplasmic reticulum-type-like [Camellia sinensis]|uniref:calcium-transporting ATPase 1, endoplasmic reticulum-type-like n=1 Tax=Camellia sinensis TaxID=4442 RepID=UPI0010357A3F|nr:calcium-transporting ATPase 1, endoplasmic reticulum-type-like [Camellia sinensis]XP_028125333.1 calcium-transporting ATPase 1, endoplasmic reticulum-type-like [Camellia sinensis]
MISIYPTLKLLMKLQSFQVVMVEKMGLPDGLDSGTSKGYGDVLRCCRTWSKIERRIATLEFDRDRKSMGVIVSSSSRRKSLLVKVLHHILSRFDTLLGK